MQSGAAQLEVSCTRGVYASPRHPAKHTQGPGMEVVGLTHSLGAAVALFMCCRGCSWGRGREAMDPARHRLPPAEVLGTTECVTAGNTIALRGYAPRSAAVQGW